MHERRGSQVNHAAWSIEDGLWFPQAGRKDRSCFVAMRCMTSAQDLGPLTSLIWMALSTCTSSQTDASLQMVTSWKRQEGNVFAFAFAFSSLGVQYFSVKQVWTGHFIGIAKALGKNDLPKP